MKIFLTITALFLQLVAYSQLARIDFAQPVVDLGTILEEDGRQTVSFDFTNQGDTDLVIENVECFCGCTSVNWPKNSIPVKGKGTVVVTFNPMGRSGNFDKQLRVYSNSPSEMVSLHLKGEIIPTYQLKSLNVKIDSLLLSKSFVQFGTLEKGMIREDFVRIFNTSSKKIKLDFINIPAYLEISTEPETLDPLDEGFIKLKINTGKIKAWGNLSQGIQVMVNNEIEVPSNRNIQIYSQIIDPVTDNNARLELDRNYFDIGKLRPGQEKKIKISVRSVGNSTLYIRDIVCNLPKIEVISYPKKIKAGKSGKMTVRIRNIEPGDDNELNSVSLQTNDTEDPISLLVFKWETLK